MRWILASLSLALPVLLQAAPPVPPAGTGKLPPLAEIDFFALDGAADYVARFASSPPSRERLERSKQVEILRPHPRSPLFTASVVGDIVVVEGGGGYTYTDPCPEPDQSQTCTYFNDNAVTDIANEVLRYSNDEHDMIVMFTTFAQTGAGYAAYYLPLQNDITGLGDCNEYAGESHGCIFDTTRGLKVQGLQYMSSVDSWEWQEQSYFGRTSPVTSLDHWVHSGLGHEVLHRWGSALRFKHPVSGEISKEMLGESLAHWNPALDGAGGMHYGWDWEDLGDGSFDLLGESFTYSDLELYVMGVLPAAQVEPWFLLQNARSDELSTLFRAMGYNISPNIGGVGQFIPLPPVPYLEDVIRQYYPSMGEHITATGNRLDLNIDDVLGAEGPRVPASGAAPDHFRQVWVLVTRPDQSVSSVGNYVAELQTARKVFEQWFVENSRGRARICTNLSSPCPEPALQLRGPRVDDSLSNDNGVVDRNESLDVYVAVRNAGELDAHGVQVEVRSLDENLAVDRAEATLGDLAVGDARETGESLLLYVDKQAACAEPLRYELNVTARDAAPVTLLGYLYPGLEVVERQGFEDGDEGWTFNPGGEDDAAAGHFARGSSVARKAGGTLLTPAGQAMGAHALFTDPSSDGEVGDHDVDDGFTSVLSPIYALKDLRDPYLAYRYWHVAVNGAGEHRGIDENRLLVEFSSDEGKSFRELVKHQESAPQWYGALVRIKDFVDPLPESIRFRFTQFDDGGDDLVEAGIDEVQLLEPVGDCAPDGCGCAATGPERASLVLLTLAVLGLLRLRRR